ncbi:BQ5605_C011g06566 [Microbotryum silenes-dioicae]|uniref:BQ5605_C011g06566 protein n=1 Tax=Microbotryum silenes-dioicae TaxID=796604 RepID=A0A2X0LPH6_9BASI|nr:BQ5605_C011g06566 [Microbotryum silenes-dioicae]
MNMTIAELLAFDVAPADASLHIEFFSRTIVYQAQLSKFWSKLTPTSSCSTQGRPMDSSDSTRGEAGVGVSNTEEGRSTTHSSVLKGLVQSMGPSRCEDTAGTTRSLNEIQKNAYIEDGRIQRQAVWSASTTLSSFGSLDGAVTATTPLEIGSLICFGLKCGMHSLSCEQTVSGEEALSIGIGTRIQSDTKPLQPRHARLVGSTLKCRRTGASPHQENMLFHTPH